MATATRRHTITDPRERSVELARAQHLNSSVRTVSLVQNADGTLRSLTVRVPSRHTRNAFHTVTYFPATDSATCDCTAGSFHHACSHAGAAIFAGRALASEMTPAGRAEAERAYLADLASAGNFAALAPSF